MAPLERVGMKRGVSPFSNLGLPLLLSEFTIGGALLARTSKKSLNIAFGLGLIVTRK
jgi:hypothetical protein